MTGIRFRDLLVYVGMVSLQLVFRPHVGQHVSLLATFRVGKQHRRHSKRLGGTQGDRYVGKKCVKSSAKQFALLVEP